MIKLHRMALLFFDLATRGLRKLARKVKFFAFWAFFGDFDAFKGFLKAMGWMKATGCEAEGLGTAGRRPQDGLPKARGLLAKCQG